MIRIPKGLSRRVGLVVGALLVLAAEAGWSQEGPLQELADEYPRPALSAEDVVRIQMEAFRNNDENDTGIAIAFRFASPQNKEMTGPLSRFAMMMRNPLYRPMLEAQGVEYGFADVRERVARIEVSTVDSEGDRRRYAFFLVKQAAGEYENAWMTEAVEVLPPGGDVPDGSV